MSVAPAVASVVAEPGQFEHLGLLYRDAGGYVEGTTTFVREALAAGNPVLVAVPGRNGELIRTGLGADARGVEFADMAVAGSNPGRIIPGVLLAFAAAHAGRRPWIIGEPIWPGRTEIEYPACAAHEALINVAFTGRDAAILCPYDVGGLDPRAVCDAERTHPVMVDGARRWPSAAYADPVDAAATFNLPLPVPPPGAARMRYAGHGALAGVRRFVARYAEAAGLLGDRLSDLVVAVNELTTNTTEHSGGPGELTAWVEGGSLVCQVRDRGQLRDPLAGRVPPTAEQGRGRGLFVVNQLCDFVRAYSGPAGTAIRLHMRLPD